jgi:hypothetical protein
MKPNTQNRRLVVMSVLSAFALSLFAVGCDRTVSHTETSHVRSDGSVSTKEKTVTEHPDGSVSKTESHSTSNP